MIESIITLVTATALLLGSPGPAPLALAATSATFGVRAGIPFLFGILAGLSVAITAATIGLTTLFSTYPSAILVVQILGGLYICYIAFKIATAPVSDSTSKPNSLAPSFIDGFILNLLNPKAYAAFFAIFSQFLLPLSNTFSAFLTTGLVCILVATLVDVAWLGLGGVIGPVFKHPIHARRMRITFAALMVFAVFWALFR